MACVCLGWACSGGFRGGSQRFYGSEWALKSEAS